MRDQQIKNAVCTLSMSRRIIDNLARLVKAGVMSEHEARQIMRIEPHDDYVEPTT